MSEEDGQDELAGLKADFSDELRLRNSELIDLRCQLSMNEKVRLQLEARLEDQGRLLAQDAKRANELAHQFESKLTEKENLILRFEKDKKRDMQALEEEVARLTDQNRRLSQEVQALRDTCLATIEEKDEIMEQMAELENKLQQATEGGRDVRYCELNDRLAEQTDQFNERMRQKLQELEEREVEVSQLRDKLASVNEEYSQKLQEAEAQYQAMIEQAQSQSIQQRNDIERNFYSEISELQDKNSQVLKRNKELEFEVIRIKRELEDIISSHEHERQVNRQKSERGREAEARQLQLQKEVEHLKKDIERDRAARERALEARQENQKKALEHDLQRRRLNQQISELQTRLNELEQDNRMLKSRLRDVLSASTAEGSSSEDRQLLGDRDDELGLRESGEDQSLRGQVERLEQLYGQAVRQSQKARSQMLSLKQQLQAKVSEREQRSADQLLTITKLETEFLRAKLSAVETIEQLKEEKRQQAAEFGKKEERLNQKIIGLQEKYDKVSGKGVIFRNYVTNFK